MLVCHLKWHRLTGHKSLSCPPYEMLKTYMIFNLVKISLLNIITHLHICPDMHIAHVTHAFFYLFFVVVVVVDAEMEQEKQNLISCVLSVMNASFYRPMHVDRVESINAFKDNWNVQDKKIEP